MTTAQVNLTDEKFRALDSMARQTGKSWDDLLNEAVDQLLENSNAQAIRRPTESEVRERLAAMKAVFGIWKDRDDLPDFDELRKSWGARLTRFGLD